MELLNQTAPGSTRVAVLRDPTAAGIGQFSAIQSVAQSLAIELVPLGLRDPGEIERSFFSSAQRYSIATLLSST